jgi:hypothetical protein
MGLKITADSSQYLGREPVNARLLTVGLAFGAILSMPVMAQSPAGCAKSAQAEGTRQNVAQAEGTRQNVAQAEGRGQQVARMADPCR